MTLTIQKCHVYRSPSLERLRESCDSSDDNPVYVTLTLMVCVKGKLRPQDMAVKVISLNCDRVPKTINSVKITLFAKIPKATPVKFVDVTICPDNPKASILVVREDAETEATSAA